MTTIHNTDCSYSPYQVTLISKVKSILNPPTRALDYEPIFLRKPRPEMLYTYSFFVELSSGTRVLYDFKDGDKADSTHKQITENVTLIFKGEML